MEQQKQPPPEKALFLYDINGEELIEAVKNNPFGVAITAITFKEFTKAPEKHIAGTSHVIISGDILSIKQLFKFAVQYQFSIGIIPAKHQKNLKANFALSDNLDQAITTALSEPDKKIDLIKCNNKILLFKATMGRLPLLDTPQETNWFQKTLCTLRDIFRLRLKKYTLTVGGNEKITTAASGCMIIQQQENSLAAKLIEHDNNSGDGMLSLVIAAPTSIVEYIKYIIQLSQDIFSLKDISSTIGYIKTDQLDIETSTPIDVIIDDIEVVTTPLYCSVIPAAVNIKTGSTISENTNSKQSAEQIINIDNLPRKKEVNKAQNKHIPLFSYASEERFKDLFRALRSDAAIDMNYISLMVLSTLLATVGLYLNSSSVIIGAMLLAPLMSPIVSLAMGLLRGDEQLLFKSFKKILLGIFLALIAAALMSLLFPYKPVTSEMQARLHPTLMDLAVAIIAGIAGAYTKSFKEILQSLAGVGIAVALVPPLAVAGIGLGRLDPYFAMQAFLLFSTNLVGIILAAAYTFRVLGFSPVIRHKKGVAFVSLTMIIIAIPLFFSYQRIIEKTALEKSWQTERFLVNGKYLIVKDADLTNLKDRKVLYVNLMARDQLTRHDLALFKEKIQSNFDKKLIVRASITYIP